MIVKIELEAPETASNEVEAICFLEDLFRNKLTLTDEEQKRVVKWLYSKYHIETE